MALEFDDETAVATEHAEAAAGEELERGQLAYEALADVVAELDARTLMAVVAAVQRGDEWAKLPAPVRAAFEQLEGELFEADEDQEAA